MANAPKSQSTGSKWATFLTANSTLYTAVFAKGATPLVSGITLTKAVQSSLKSLAIGKWETTTIRQGGKTVVIVAFADKDDFNKVKSHHSGKPWKSIVRGSIDGFSVILP